MWTTQIRVNCQILFKKFTFRVMVLYNFKSLLLQIKKTIKMSVHNWQLITLGRVKTSIYRHQIPYQIVRYKSMRNKMVKRITVSSQCSIRKNAINRAKFFKYDIPVICALVGQRSSNSGFN